MSFGLRWTNQRKVFGKSLNSQAVIRAKLAEMISRAESMCYNSLLVPYQPQLFYISPAVQNWLENVTYQMCNMVCIPCRSSMGF